MTKLVLSTSNIMGTGPSIQRRPTVEKSNAELTTSLRASFSSAAAASSRHSSSSSSPPTNGATATTTTITDTNGASTTSPTPHSRPAYPPWTSRDASTSTLYIPARDPHPAGLAEDRPAYDITVKLFYLPSVPAERRAQHTRDAVALVCRELRVDSIDLLIASVPGITFDAEDEDEDEDEDEEGEKLPAEAEALDGEGTEDDLAPVLATWPALEALHASGAVRSLGTSEFSSARLSRLLRHVRVRPAVNQINVRDCCVVPKPLILFAKREGIELLTHNDCTNILPRGTLRELLGPTRKGGAGVLAGSEEGEEGLKGDVEPQWVVKYTAVVKDRGVVENKGYFAVAELKE
ncbi:hypothetical protein BDY21DRAFT_382450 [Lineolata rhizophorae]|uniref:GCS light chain n=1 Tax=Lineolata rhizophorae TaxID=578093 RepID=A0A6A6NMU2_9PEZI|nr:hypothetical protein BDY21DRAFT_382450 [Lineolata rhizophorae]